LRRILRRVKQYLKETIIHYLAGGVSGFTLYLYPLFSIILLALFLMYEISEWYIERDTLFPEIREYTVGYVAGFIMFLIVKLIS